MRWSIGIKIGISFGIALVLLIVIGAVSYDSTSQLIASAGTVRHTFQVLTELEDLLSTLKDAETGQRGYVITGAKRYLEPYQGAATMAEEKLKNIRQLTVDNSAQQERITALEPLLAAKFAELQ